MTGAGGGRQKATHLRSATGRPTRPDPLPRGPALPPSALCPAPPLLQKLATFVATPVEGTATSPPHLLLNQLPFFEDARQYPFQTFDKDAW